VADRAAGTAVDAAGTREDDAPRINGDSPRHLAEASRELDAVPLHVSTDQVFPGDAEEPYTQDAPTGPCGAYGRTGPADDDVVRTMVKLEAVNDALGGATTWPGFTREAFRLLGADPERVRPTTGAAFARPAPRPAYSVLRHSRWQQAGIEPIGDWSGALSCARPVLVAESQEGNPWP
jgi:dTDP-4-dehydrorhamnose reductase